MALKGIPILNEKVCHEITHDFNYSGSKNRGNNTLPISEINALMFFCSYNGEISEIKDINYWKELVLQAINLYTKEETPEIYEIFIEFGIEDILYKHFDDIFDLYSILLNSNEFHSTHKKASNEIGRCSNIFNRNKREYPELSSQTDRSRKWARKNGLHIEELREDGFKKMIFDRAESYRIGSIHVKEHLRKMFADYRSYEKETEGLKDAWQDYHKNKSSTF
jgi:hypothetical protein